MILLDTNVVSESFQVRPDKRVVDWIDSQPEGSLCLCAPVMAELRFGADRLMPGRKQTRLHAALDRVDELFRGRILPFENAAVPAYSRLMVERQRTGRRIELIDALIAAIAVTYGTSLATRDTSDFADLGLDLINPFEAPVA